jgi:hypothetical protein
MSEFASFPEEHKMPAEVETILTQMLDEIRVLNEKMRIDQIEIDRLKAESKIITEHTDAVLAQIRVQMDALQRTK